MADACRVAFVPRSMSIGQARPAYAVTFPFRAAAGSAVTSFSSATLDARW
jgi:hypothetical protein